MYSHLYFFVFISISIQSDAACIARVHLEYLLRALGDIVLTSSFVDRYAGASRTYAPDVNSAKATPIPWKPGFSPFANEHGMCFLMKYIKYSSFIKI